MVNLVLADAQVSFMQLFNSYPKTCLFLIVFLTVVSTVQFFMSSRKFEMVLRERKMAKTKVMELKKAHSDTLKRIELRFVDLLNAKNESIGQLLKQIENNNVNDTYDQILQHLKAVDLERNTIEIDIPNGLVSVKPRKASPAATNESYQNRKKRDDDSNGPVPFNMAI